MATYPVLPIMRPGSVMARAGGQMPVRATNGMLRVRRMFFSERSDFTLVHWLSAAQRSTLETFYQANKDLDVDFLWPGDGATYVVRFGAPPQYAPRSDWFEARVQLLQV
jgi:hypothetical protein